MELKEQAKQKLKNEMEKSKDKTFAEQIIPHLLKRCEDDAGLAEDVMQEWKEWEKCYDYIVGKARKQANGKTYACVSDNQVFEWAEDYYHKDDKAEEEKAKKEAERKKQVSKKESDPTRKGEISSDEKPQIQVETKKKVAKPKKQNKELEGQMDLFSMMGM